MNEKYKVLELIGEGSFGRVFKGQVKATGEYVALKLIPKVSKSESDLNGLRNEFKIQQKLNHPNVVRVIESFETQNEIVAVTEYLPGELHKLFDLYKSETGGKEARSLPESRVREIAVDLLSALHYLHQNRILHRDVKPQNVLMDAKGRAKLCDFGFARNLGLNTHVLTSIKGTPLYMAPELIEERPYDQAADLWSVGCILYELLVGSPPFSTKNIIQLINKVRHDSIQWPEDMNDTCRSFLQGLLEKDSRKRFTWPDLLQHPFVAENLRHLASESLPPSENPLTEELSESRELAKEMQRQDKAKALPGNSQTLLRMAAKHEAEKQRIQSAMDRERHHRAHNRGRRNSDTNLASGIDMFGHQRPAPPVYHAPQRRHSDYPHVQDPNSLLPLYMLGQLQYLTPQPPLTAPQPLPDISGFRFPTQAPNVAPQPPVMLAPAQMTEKPRELTASVVKPTPAKAEKLPATLTSLSVDEKPLEVEEWLGFIDQQLEEVNDDVNTLDNENFVSMIVGPLKNKNVTPEILEKVTDILIIPFVAEHMPTSTLAKILATFSKVRVISHLFLSLKHLHEEIKGCDLLLNVACLITRLVYQSFERFSAEIDSLLVKEMQRFRDLLCSEEAALTDEVISWLNLVLYDKHVCDEAKIAVKKLSSDRNVSTALENLAHSKRTQVFLKLLQLSKAG